MEVCTLLVAQESVWCPDLGPAVIAQSYLLDLATIRRVDEALVGPRLTQVHAHHVVLCNSPRR